MKIIQTLDGSSTLASEHFDGELYHSSNGAIQEANHVYIRFITPDIKILEIGFGSGLNALLSLQTKLNLDYTTLELYPVDSQTVGNLSFCNENLIALHQAPWNQLTQITKDFKLTKLNINIEDNELLNNKLTQMYDLVFFDAFAPDTVPNQWTPQIFKTIYSKLNPQAKLVTYSAKGIVKQALRDAGFIVKREKGAPGKHHMLVATKF